jgi:hypothetical protein
VESTNTTPNDIVAPSLASSKILISKEDRTDRSSVSTESSPDDGVSKGSPGLGFRLSPQDFEIVLIEVLKGLGGKARKRDVEAEVFQRRQETFSQSYYQQLVGRGVPRWKKNLQFAWDRAKKRG